MPFKQLLTQNIGRRILLSFFLLSSILTILSVALFIYTKYSTEKEDIINNTHTLIKSQTNSLSGILWNFDIALANINVKSLSESPNISYIAVIDDKNATFSSSGDITAPYTVSTEIPLTIEINNQKRKIGTVKAHITTISAKEQVKNDFVKIVLIQALKSTITSFFFLLLIYQIIIRHIRKITSEITTVNQDENKFAVPDLELDRPYRDDELQYLVDTINKNKRLRLNHLEKLNNEKQRLTEEIHKRETAEENAKESHHQLLHVLNSLTVAVFSCKHDGEIIFMNFNALKLLNHYDASRATTNDSLYINNAIRVHKSKTTSHSSKIDFITKSQESEYASKTDAYYSPINGENTSTPIELSVIPAKSTSDSQGNPQKPNFIVVIKDRTNEEKLEAMTYTASHDYLTNIYNRMYLTEEINKKILEKTDRYSLAIIDLDKFKAVNDISGHAAGDQLLKLIANTIPKLLGPYDIFARIGGDEFSILFNSDPSQSKNTSKEIIKTLENLNFTYDNNLHSISCSIGISALRPDDHQVEQVMSRADQACYQAKRKSGGSVIIYQKPISKLDTTVTTLHKQKN